MQNKLKFFVPSIADVIFIMLFLVLSLHVPSMLLIDDYTGLHIKIGEYILNTFSLPQYDIYSSIMPPHPYIVYKWLSEVVMALVYHYLGGLTGLVVFFFFSLLLPVTCCSGF